MKILKQLLIYILSILSLCGSAENTSSPVTEVSASPYLVLLGEDSQIVGTPLQTDLLVIDADYFTREDIASLRENGAKEIYTYLNIGSLENFRDCYEDFEAYSLGEYENWPQERWMDTGNTLWQTYLDKKARELSEKGIDGFFIDNTDVYYQYPTEDIYDGIVIILKNLRSQGKKVILNGGDVFVTKYLKSAATDSLFDGINQESVYTTYDFEKGKGRRNTKEDRTYYESYLDSVLEMGYTVYTLEYTDDDDIAKEATDYSALHGYITYISKDIELRLNGRRTQSSLPSQTPFYARRSFACSRCFGYTLSKSSIKME